MKAEDREAEPRLRCSFPLDSTTEHPPSPAGLFIGAVLGAGLRTRRRKLRTGGTIPCFLRVPNGALATGRLLQYSYTPNSAFRRSAASSWPPPIARATSEAIRDVMLRKGASEAITSDPWVGRRMLWWASRPSGEAP